MSPAMQKFLSENPYFKEFKEETKNLVEILVFNFQPENLYFLSAMVDYHNNPTIALATFITTIFIKPGSICEINIDNKNRTHILNNYKVGVAESQKSTQALNNKKKRVLF